MGVNSKTFKLQLSAMEKRIRTPKPQAKPQPHAHFPPQNRPTRRVPGKNSIGPGTRFKPGQLPQNPIIIDDSEDEARDSGKIATAFTSSHRQATTKTSSWLEDSIRPPTSAFAPDLSQYRYTHAMSVKTGYKTIDHIQYLYQNGTDVILDRNLTLPTVPLPSQEQSVFMSGVQRDDESNNIFDRESTIIQREQTRSLPSRPAERQYLQDITTSRAAYPNPARTENTYEDDGDSKPPTPPCVNDIVVRGSSSTTRLTTRSTTRSTASDDRAPPSIRRRTMRELKESGRFARLKEPTPPPSEYITQAHPTPHTTHKSRLLLPPPVPSSDQRINLGLKPCIEVEHPTSLADIPDSGTRSKVGQLMAIAPIIPIQDLYSLLMEKEGFFVEAKDQVLQYLSRTQIPQSSIVPSATTLSVPLRNQEKDREVKIDFDDPDIWMDNGVSPSPPPRRPAPKKASQKEKKKTTLPKSTSNTKASSKSASISKYSSPNLERTLGPKRRLGKPKRAVANIEPKRPRGSRNCISNSRSDRFISPDDDSVFNSDESYEDTESEDATDYEYGSDVDMEDLGEDLDIDMTKF